MAERTGGELDCASGPCRSDGLWRIGLPMRSLHEGSVGLHTPLRLSVFVEAPVAGIDHVTAKRDRVRPLPDNEWLHLFRIEPDAPGLSRFQCGSQAAVPSSMQAD